jgi:hypothetical protein
VAWARPGGCLCRLRPLIFVGIASLIGVAYLNVLKLTMDLIDPPIGPRRWRRPPAGPGGLSGPTTTWLGDSAEVRRASGSGTVVLLGSAAASVW